MIIQEFWSRAYLASLHRLPPLEAKQAADEALEICLQHWQSKKMQWAPLWRHWHEQDVTDCAPSEQLD